MSFLLESSGIRVRQLAQVADEWQRFIKKNSFVFPINGAGKEDFGPAQQRIFFPYFPACLQKKRW